MQEAEKNVTPESNRRDFIRKSVGAAAGLVIASIPEPIGAAPAILSPRSPSSEIYSGPPRIRFSVIGLNHGHIYGLVNTAIKGGGEPVAFYAKEPELAEAFKKRFPAIKQATSEKEILEDNSIQLVVSAAIPNERAALGIQVMKHGKDFLVDKPGATSLEQLAQIRQVQKQTKRIYSILYGRLENRATTRAAELVREGAIGKVVQTIGLGPHRLNAPSRDPWFFDNKKYGGIICDIASHQFDQYLYFTGSTRVDIIAAQAGNVNHPQYPLLEDFGDVVFRGDGGMGYVRVDWLSPDGLNTFGDGRLTILGTEGYIEIRQTVDLVGKPGGGHLFLVNKNQPQYIDTSKVELPYAVRLVDDILNRTETALSQEMCFQATELTLKAQKMAQRVKLKA